VLKENDSVIKMVYNTLSYLNYTQRYIKISTPTAVTNINFVMLMTSFTILFGAGYRELKDKAALSDIHVIL
jgi:hypothetical protein